MIISASRRTDIPAICFDWFCQRLRECHVDVVNQFNRKQVSRISLRHEAVDCIVFWTKNASPEKARLGFDGHDPKGTVITGRLLGDEKITVHE